MARHKKKKLIDGFDWFFLGLAFALLFCYIYYDNYLDNKDNLDIPSKCYTNLVPSGYFTSPILKPIIVNNNSLTIDGYDNLHISQTVGTGSMNPLMRPGSILIYVYPKTVSIGDILIYKNGNESIVHRVINITENGFILKGDNNLAADVGIVRPENVYGKVVGILWLFRILI